MSTPASSFSDKGDSHLGTLSAKTKTSIVPVASASPAVLPSPPLHPSEVLDNTDTEEEQQLEPHLEEEEEEEEEEEREVLAIEEIHRVVRDRYNNCDVEDYPTFYLPRGQQSYDRLLAILEQRGLLEYFQDIRSRWNASTGRLTLIFMADAIHEVLRQKFDYALEMELDRLAEEYPSIQPLRNNIVAGGHTHIQRDGWKRSPDGQAHYVSVKYPPFVYEIAHSQKEKDLDETVDEYFDHLPGHVGAVLTFKFDYNADLVHAPDFSCSAWVSLWVASIQGDTLYQVHRLDNVAFRKEGQSLPGTLELPLELFLPPSRRHTIPDDARDAKIRFDFGRLGQWVSVAEIRQRQSKEGTPPEELQVSSLLKRKVKWDSQMGEISTHQIKKRRNRLIPTRSEGQTGGPATRTRSRSTTRR